MADDSPRPHRAEGLFPELALFPDAKAQKAAWRSAQWVLLRSWRMWLLMACMLGLVLPAMFYVRRRFGGYVPFGVPPEVSGGIIGGLVGMVSAIIGYRLAARQIRRALRRRLHALAVPVCMHCGYDLRGQREPRCPECGQPA